MSDPQPRSAVEALTQRRTIQKFDPDRPVADSLLRRLLRLAATAPSSHNLQPWRFLVIREDRGRARLAAAAYGQQRIHEAPVVVLVLAALRPDQSHLLTIVDELRQRGLIDEPASRAIGPMATRSIQRWSEPSLWALRTAMLATANLLTAAEALGLGSSLIEDFDARAVRAAFGIPDDHALAAIVAIGYPRETPPEPGRLPLDQLCFEEHFGQPWNLGDL